MSNLTEQEKEHLTTALYEYTRQIEPTKENKDMVESLCTKIGLNEELPDYVICDIGADYIE